MNKKIKKHLFIICIIILISETFLVYNSKKSNAAEMQISSIGMSLVENGTIISKRGYAGDGQWNGTTEGDLSGELFEIDATMIEFEKNYKEELCIKNSGGIDIYARVIVTISWANAEGKKDTSLNPNFINLETKDQDNWLIPESQSTPERYVMYYKKIIPIGEYTTNFIDNIYISQDVIKAYEIEEETTTEGKVITMKSLYDGATAHFSIEVDAVQTHNAEDAIKSAWGVNATVDEGESGDIYEIE